MSGHSAFFQNVSKDDIEIRLRSEIDRWFNELPLYRATEISHLLEWDKKLNDLVEKIAGVQIGKDQESNLHNVIVKWLRKLHFLPGQSLLINEFANDLEKRLQDSKEDKTSKFRNKRLTKSKTVINIVEDFKTQRQNLGSVIERSEKRYKNENGINNHTLESNINEINENWKTNSRSVSKITTASLIEDTVKDWCNAIQILVDDKDKKRVSDGLATKIINKINELNNDRNLLDDEISYDVLLDGALDKYISEIPPSIILQQMRDTFKYQLKESIRIMKPLIKESIDVWYTTNKTKSESDIPNESEKWLQSIADRRDIVKDTSESSSDSESQGDEAVEIMKSNHVAKIFLSLGSTRSKTSKKDSSSSARANRENQTNRDGSENRDNNECDPSCRNQQRLDNSEFHSLAEGTAFDFTDPMQTSGNEEDDSSNVTPVRNVAQAATSTPSPQRNNRSSSFTTRPRSVMPFVASQRQQGQCSPMCEAVNPSFESPQQMLANQRGSPSIISNMPGPSNRNRSEIRDRRRDLPNFSSNTTPPSLSFEEELQLRWHPGPGDPEMPYIYFYNSTYDPPNMDENYDMWVHNLYTHSSKGPEEFQRPYVPPFDEADYDPQTFRSYLYERHGRTRERLSDVPPCCRPNPSPYEAAANVPPPGAQYNYMPQGINRSMPAFSARAQAGHGMNRSMPPCCQPVLPPCCPQQNVMAPDDVVPIQPELFQAPMRGSSQYASMNQYGAAAMGQDFQAMLGGPAAASSPYASVQAQVIEQSQPRVRFQSPQISVAGSEQQYSSWGLQDMVQDLDANRPAYTYMRPMTVPGRPESYVTPQSGIGQQMSAAAAQMSAAGVAGPQDDIWNIYGMVEDFDANRPRNAYNAGVSVQSIPLPQPQYVPPQSMVQFAEPLQVSATQTSFRPPFMSSAVVSQSSPELQAMSRRREKSRRRERRSDRDDCLCLPSPWRRRPMCFSTCDG